MTPGELDEAIRRVCRGQHPEPMLAVFRNADDAQAAIRHLDSQVGAAGVLADKLRDEIKRMRRACRAALDEVAACAAEAERKHRIGDDT